MVVCMTSMCMTSMCQQSDRQHANIPVRSLISAAGSSNMLVRLASCASLFSFCEVPWMPSPMRAARRANSECCDPAVPFVRGAKPVCAWEQSLMRPLPATGQPHMTL